MIYKKYLRIIPTGKPSTPKSNGLAAWREIDGKAFYFRSKFEANFARTLVWQKKNNVIQGWEYEPETFWFEGIKRGCVSYKPDFKIINNDGTHYWVEVKGYMDPKSKTKIKRFAKYFPQEKLFLIQKQWFTKNAKTWKGLIKDWE